MKKANPNDDAPTILKTYADNLDTSRERSTRGRFEKMLTHVEEIEKEYLKSNPGEDVNTCEAATHQLREEAKNQFNNDAKAWREAKNEEEKKLKEQEKQFKEQKNILLTTDGVQFFSKYEKVWSFYPENAKAKVENIIQDALRHFETFHTTSIVHEITVPENGQLHVIGDIHGDRDALFTYLDRIGDLSKQNQVLFLGDIIDRGKYEWHCLLTVFLYCSRWPHYCHVLRGNHEVPSTSSVYGLFGQKGYNDVNEEIFTNIQKIFESLPFCYTINNSIFACHGGPPFRVTERKFITNVKNDGKVVSFSNVDDVSQKDNVAIGKNIYEVESIQQNEVTLIPISGPIISDQTHETLNLDNIGKTIFHRTTVFESIDLNTLKKILLPINVDDDKVSKNGPENQLLWNDPTQDTEFKLKASGRGGDCYVFGKVALKKWMDDSGIKRVLRAHQVKENGCAITDEFKDGKLFTIFSAPNYVQRENTGGYLLMTKTAVGDVDDDGFQYTHIIKNDQFNPNDCSVVGKELNFFNESETIDQPKPAPMTPTLSPESDQPPPPRFKRATEQLPRRNAASLK